MTSKDRSSLNNAILILCGLRVGCYCVYGYILILILLYFYLDYGFHYGYIWFNDAFSNQYDLHSYNVNYLT